MRVSAHNDCRPRESRERTETMSKKSHVTCSLLNDRERSKQSALSRHIPNLQRPSRGQAYLRAPLCCAPNVSIAFREAERLAFKYTCRCVTFIAHDKISRSKYSVVFRNIESVSPRHRVNLTYVFSIESYLLCTIAASECPECHDGAARGAG